MGTKCPVGASRSRASGMRRTSSSKLARGKFPCRAQSTSVGTYSRRASDIASTLAPRS